jgi:hypothetical protein
MRLIQPRLLWIFMIMSMLFIACNHDNPPTQWRMVTPALSGWSCVKRSEMRHDTSSALSIALRGKQLSINTNLLQGGDLFFYAPDTMDFELLLNGKALIQTNGQGAIWPGISFHDEVPIYKWSKESRPFVVRRDVWSKNLKAGDNSLLLKIKFAPTDSAFVHTCGLYTQADVSENGMIELNFNTFKEEKLAVLQIDVDDILVKQKEKVSAHLKILCADANDCRELERNIEIGIRGFSSSMYPKKQYSFHFAKDSLQKEKIGLLGMSPASKWILQGLYSDPSLVRNAFAYELWRKMGYHAAQSRFVEVVINGVYQGVYLLMERIEVNSARLDLNSKREGSDAFLVQLNRPDKKDVVLDAAQMRFIVEDPAGILVDSVYLKGLKSSLDDLATRAMRFDRNDPMVDWNSFADFVVLEELSKNADAYFVSTFIHRGNSFENSKITAGPVWDFDLGFAGSQILSANRPEELMIDISAKALPFFKQLYRNPDFKLLCRERYLVWRKSVLSDEQLMAVFDSLSSQVDDAARQRNFQRFPVFGLNKFLTHPAPILDYQNEVGTIKSWLQSRALWLDTHLGVD